MPTENFEIIWQSGERKRFGVINGGVLDAIFIYLEKDHYRGPMVMRHNGNIVARTVGEEIEVLYVDTSKC